MFDHYTRNRSQELSQYAVLLREADIHYLKPGPGRSHAGTPRIPAEDALTLEELSEELADATGTTADAIERGAEELEIAPPSKADVVDE